jgi:hypothetical protein
LVEFFNEIDGNSNASNERERRAYLNQAVAEVLRLRPDLDDDDILGMRRNHKEYFLVSLKWKVS